MCFSKCFTPISCQVYLLTGAQSIALNVYLARMDMGPEELVGYVEDGDETRLGLSGLRYLLSVLPSHEEVSVTF